MGRGRSRSRSYSSRSRSRSDVWDQERVQKLCEKRQEARRARDYRLADQIRDELREHGIETNDDTLTWHARDGSMKGEYGGTQRHRGRARTLTSEEVTQMCQERQDMKRDRRFEKADIIREDLRHHGVNIDDSECTWEYRGKRGKWQGPVMSAGHRRSRSHSRHRSRSRSRRNSRSPSRHRSRSRSPRRRSRSRSRRRSRSRSRRRSPSRSRRRSPSHSRSRRRRRSRTPSRSRDRRRRSDSRDRDRDRDRRDRDRRRGGGSRDGRGHADKYAAYFPFFPGFLGYGFGKDAGSRSRSRDRRRRRDDSRDRRRRSRS